MADSCKITVILGPTASGKSDLAMAHARATGAEILSLDSMQVYRGLDVGTAKPSAAERSEVRHHLIDQVDPNEVYTVARFVEAADAVIADATGRGVPLIATGGTPLYYKALFEGLFEGPSAEPALRAKLSAMGNEALAERLRAADPAAAARIHLNDTRRLIRALEVYELTGKPITSFQNEWGTATMRHAATWVGLDWDREVLNRRINARVKAMLAAGWVEETRTLLDRFGALSHTAAEATGYRELIAHLEGKMSLEEATEQIKIATRQLARKQMKWFRRFPNVKWLKGDSPLQELLAQVPDMPTKRPAQEVKD
ncbi:MAG TPA: tRNA (adenosine(37)-N6)-dimethylallyltransferase MiaA [Tepidisphaeraceae bacterium]|jgi:tRNA dimethylallyltransferase|nr:tRNA (adenosine(37)-N6)-dimethylallyltransferase MiaA [Tepidisphaeraceae bacterium]